MNKAMALKLAAFQKARKAEKAAKIRELAEIRRIGDLLTGKTRVGNRSWSSPQYSQGLEHIERFEPAVYGFRPSNMSQTEYDELIEDARLRGHNVMFGTYDGLEPRTFSESEWLWPSRKPQSWFDSFFAKFFGR